MAAYYFIWVAYRSCCGMVCCSGRLLLTSIGILVRVSTHSKTFKPLPILNWDRSKVLVFSVYFIISLLTISLNLTLSI